MLLLGRWFSKVSAVAYRKARETVALLIVYFVESMGGVRAVQAYRREERDKELFSGLNVDNRFAQAAGHQQNAFMSGGMRGIGHLATVVVLLFGGWQVMQGNTELGGPPPPRCPRARGRVGNRPRRRARCRRGAPGAGRRGSPPRTCAAALARRRASWRRWSADGRWRA
jgi:ABC-type multidrug transport system fused ATPase/permease subunit